MPAVASEAPPALSPVATVMVAVMILASCTTYEESTSSGSGQRLWIRSETVDCVGEAAQKCLLVRETADGPEEYFYDTIDGFDYVPGFTYVIDVEITEIDDPPADGSSLAYRLIEIVETTPA